MQANLNEDSPSEATRKMMRDFENNLRLSDHENEEESQDDCYEDVDDEEDFSFAFDSDNFSTMSAEDVFFDGQIKSSFPLFNQALLLPEGEDLESLMMKDNLPKVNRVFVVAEDGDSNAVPETSSAKGDGEDIMGPYCEWSSKVVEAASPEQCKKSNSTGFSKIWRFKDFMHRSNSDGRDAFVFLNHATPSSSTTASGKREDKAATTTTTTEKENFSLKKVGGNGEVAGEVKVKKVRKSKTAALSAHEVYMRSKAKEGARRRSYLPYRPELVGLFTNVTGGGLTRNVHPF